MLNEQSLIRAFKTLIIDKLLAIVELIVVGTALEPATSSKLGGVKIGSGVNVTEDGTISVPTPATDWTLLGEYAHGAEITLPNNYKEALIIVCETTGNWRHFAVGHLLPTMKPTWGNYMQNLCFGNSVYAVTFGFGPLNNIKLLAVSKDGTDVKESSKSYIYYK